jgi:DNA-binding transcriptional ArsR family regulator
MVDDLEHVWKALADPTRRRLLDLLRDQPRTTGWLAGQFPQLSRFAVMKHLGVLEEAGLVLVRRKGRERWNFINTVPIRQIYERWMGPYAEMWSSSLLRLKDHVERDVPKDKEPPAGGGNRES